jgi:hypothetical protein
MKKIKILMVLFLAVTISGICQLKPEKEVADAVDQVIKGIVDADESLLKSITADELVYGHSSGNVQNKTQFIEEIISGKPLDYISARLDNQTIQLSVDVAVVRHIYSAETSNNGVPGQLKLGVMMVLQKQHGKWKLLARQAYKVQ